MSAPVRKLDESGDVMFGRGLQSFHVGSAATVQRVRTRLLLILGEWFLNTDEGTPWWENEDSIAQPIMGVPRNLGYAEAVLKARILGTDGVASLESFSLSMNGETRKLSVSATVTDDDGVTGTIVLVSP